MGGDILSGGIVVVLAAALWLVYLLPTWLRRREYQATERNAVRLQQTLRILAETSELPAEVRLEATAREVATQQRILRKAEARTRAELQVFASEEAERRHAEALADAAAQAAADAAARAALAHARRAEPVRAVGVRAVAEAVPDAVRTRARRLRRSRAATTLLLAVGLVAAVVGGGLALAAGVSWLVPAGAAIVVVGALGNLGRLARSVRPAQSAVREHAPRVATEIFDHAVSEEPARTSGGTWTPRPLPKPLYQSPGSIAASAMASVDAVTRLRRAAAAAELDRRAAEIAERLAPTVVPLTHLAPRQTPVSEPARVPPSAPPQVPLREASSRYARMGMLDDIEPDALDLDAALRRRRAAS
ncbi:hypothetical protein [Rathayibacter soli]|uniref:hypothetical protein n=1 Tax=Rathayibacter soli TaxID=3144168 RepID=UPI0027E46D94|nr:hypothetical protein [Glaciibacter superstes]